MVKSLSSATERNTIFKVKNYNYNIMKKVYQAPTTQYMAIKTMSAILSASGNLKQGVGSHAEIFDGVLG